MIKELVLEYEKMVFNCHTNENLKQFIKLACKEIKFSKSFIFKESEEDILETYTKKNQSIAIIIYAEDCFDSEKNTDVAGVTKEFQFYSRKLEDMEYYNDWNYFKFIDFTKMLRREKIKKLNLAI